MQANQEANGQTIVMLTSPDNIAMMGTVKEEGLCDFFTTMFRASPGLKDLVSRALDDSECLQS